MNIGSILRLVLSADLDPETLRALARVLDGDADVGAEADEAVEALAHAMGVLDEVGETDEEQVRDLIDSLELGR